MGHCGPFHANHEKPAAWQPTRLAPPLGAPLAQLLRIFAWSYQMGLHGLSCRHHRQEASLDLMLASRWRDPENVVSALRQADGGGEANVCVDRGMGLRAKEGAAAS